MTKSSSIDVLRNNLTKIMNHYNLTISDISDGKNDSISLSKTSISNLLNGNGNVTLATLDKICNNINRRLSLKESNYDLKISISDILEEDITLKKRFPVKLADYYIFYYLSSYAQPEDEPELHYGIMKISSIIKKSSIIVEAVFNVSEEELKIKDSESIFNNLKKDSHRFYSGFITFSSESTMSIDLTNNGKKRFMLFQIPQGTKHTYRGGLGCMTAFRSIGINQTPYISYIGITNYFSDQKEEIEQKLLLETLDFSDMKVKEEELDELFRFLKYLESIDSNKKRQKMLSNNISTILGYLFDIIPTPSIIEADDIIDEEWYYRIAKTAESKQKLT